MEIKTCSTNKHTLETLKDSKIFNAFYEVLIFAASVGFQKEKRRALVKTDKTIELYLFEGFPGFNAIYYGISLSEEKTPNVLQVSKDAEATRYKHFEEYANGGLDILDREVLQRPGDALENLILFIKKHGSGFETGDGQTPKAFDFSFGLG